MRRGLYDPAPNGYSHVAVAAPGTRQVLVSGQGGELADGNLSRDFAAQVRQAIDNMCTALAAAGAAPTDVARLLVMVVDHSEDRLRILGAELERVCGAAMKPACTLVPVPRLALDGMLFEIEATAMLPT